MAAKRSALTSKARELDLAAAIVELRKRVADLERRELAIIGLNATGATHYLGVADTTGATLYIAGSATGSDEGGEVQIATAADHDTTINAYIFDAYQDDLRLRRGTTLALKITAEGSIILQLGDAAGVRSLAIMDSAPATVASINSDGVVMSESHLKIADGITAPGTATGYALIYVDTADGDLKVIFGDSVVKTLATDT